MTFAVGPLQAPEVPALCELFHKVFSVMLTLDQYHWKYQQGPRLGSLSLVARDSSGALVGHVGALVFPGMCQGRPIPMAQVCDVMVAHHARGGVDSSGVYGRLMTALQAELSANFPGVFAYGFAGIRPYKLGVRMGLYRAVQSCQMGFVLHCSANGQGLEPGQAECSRAELLRPYLGWTAPWVMSAQPVDWQSPDWGRLWRRIGMRTDGPVVERSAAYLQWRYAQHPQHRYQAWKLCQWGRAQGWVVVRLMPDGSLCMVDSLLPEGVDTRRAAALLAGTYLRALQPFPASAGSAPTGSQPVVVNFGSWDIQTATSVRLEPIMGCEVKVDRWHSEHEALRFQPGDTDVF